MFLRVLKVFLPRFAVKRKCWQNAGGDNVAHVINARALSREVKLKGIAACLKLKNEFWVEPMVNESKKLKEKTKSKYIGVAEEENLEKEGGQGACC